MADEGGVWKTVHGTPVFIKDGEDIGDAIKNRFGGKESNADSKGVIRSAKTGKDVEWHKAKPEEIQKALEEAKASCRPEDAWRVDTTHSLDDYKKDDCYVIGKSSLAVTEDGDIISVCRAAGDSVSGKDLLKFAVDHGGVKLDSFSGNHEFYQKCGFEPVSWTPFADIDGVRPGDWDRNRDAKEPVIFYRHTGKVGHESVADFIARVRACEGENGYDEAKKIRDNLIKKEKSK